MSRYCLDTSAYSFFSRGDQTVVEMIDTADWLGMPAVTLGELEIGFSPRFHGSYEAYRNCIR